MNRLAKIFETDEKTLQSWAKMRAIGAVKFVLCFTLLFGGIILLITWLDPFDDGRRFVIPGWEELLFDVTFVLLIAVAVWFTMEKEYARKSGGARANQQDRPV